ncbi:MAG: hypothetical protein WBM02_05175 [bacterium]
MKKILRNVSIIILLALMLLVVGDLFNFPLWPIDILATHFPVDVQIDFAGIDSVMKEKLLIRPQYINLELCKPDGTKIRKLNVDTNGVARFVIREGSYIFRASVPVVENGDWYFMTFSSGMDSDGNTIKKIHGRQESVNIVLQKTKQIPDNDLDAVFKMYLMEADFQSAGVFARDIAEDIAKDMECLLNIQNQIGELPVTAYNSILKALTQAVSILAKYDVPPDQQILSVNGEIIYLTSRIDAVTQARNSIVAKYLEILQPLYTDSQLIDLFQEWSHLTGNNEIYDSTIKNLPEFSDDLKKMEEIVSAYAHMLPDEIRLNYKEAVSKYESGELVEARNKFSRLLSFVQNVGSDLDFEEFEDIKISIGEYIDDVELITAANYAMRTDRLETALQLYDLVSRPNDLVHERILEAQRYMQLKGTGRME